MQKDLYEVIAELQEENEELREQDRRKRLRFAMLQRDIEARLAYDEEHRGGYCPKCHMLRNPNGKCDNCN